MKPYIDSLHTNNSFIREFGEDIDPIELMWHRDLTSRKVTILEGKGWLFQKEDQLPFEMKQGDIIFIKEGEWHRVIKGNSKLKIKIEE